MTRKAGVLLHISSLPAPYPIGDFGPEAYKFVDFLAAAGFTLWQILPLIPPDEKGSPYSSHSAFGISRLYISPEQLVREGFLPKERLPAKVNYELIDFGKAFLMKKDLIRESFEYFSRYGQKDLKDEFLAFQKKNWYWLDEHALFDALKEYHGGKPWYEWPDELKKRDREVLDIKQRKLAVKVEEEKYVQWVAMRQWLRLKKYANEKGIKLIGDVPFFVRHDSVDVWAHQKNYLLDENGQPKVVAGVPPDYFSKVGQLWGNPIYDWQHLQKKNFRWCVGRIHYYASLFDMLRLDHFRGYESLWQVPAKAKNAVNGQWVKTPGRELLAAIKRLAFETELIAEDLGYITPEVNDLRYAFQIPGMKVIVFGFKADSKNANLPDNFIYDDVAYTTTHDTDTLKGWLENSDEMTKKRALEYSESDINAFNDKIIERGLGSKAGIFIVPTQDILGLSSEARMNTPNTKEGNWLWRMKDGAINNELAKKYLALNKKYGRI